MELPNDITILRKIISQCNKKIAKLEQKELKKFRDTGVITIDGKKIQLTPIGMDDVCKGMKCLVWSVDKYFCTGRVCENNPESSFFGMVLSIDKRFINFKEYEQGIGERHYSRSYANVYKLT